VGVTTAKTPNFGVSVQDVVPLGGVCIVMAHRDRWLRRVVQPDENMFGVGRLAHLVDPGSFAGSKGTIRVQPGLAGWVNMKSVFLLEHLAGAGVNEEKGPRPHFDHAGRADTNASNACGECRVEVVVARAHVDRYPEPGECVCRLAVLACFAVVGHVARDHDHVEMIVIANIVEDCVERFGSVVRATTFSFGAIIEEGVSDNCRMLMVSVMLRAYVKIQQIGSLNHRYPAFEKYPDVVFLRKETRWAVFR